MNRKVWMFAAGLAAGAGALAAQELTARQLFYGGAEGPKPAAKAAPKKAAPKKAPVKPAAPTSPTIVPEPGAVAPAPAAPPVQATSAAFVASERPLGLRYAVVQVKDGVESEVNPAATFHSGDFVRVKVEANREGYLYVVARGSSGNWKPLFPAPDINGGDNKIAGHRGYRLPSDTQAFAFDEQAGEERLFVIFSADPVKDVVALIPSLAAPASTPKKELPAPGPMIMASLNDDFVSRMNKTYSRDLIVQTVTPGAAPPAAGPATLPENAVYVVNRSGGRVVADIRLEHK